MPGYVKIMSTGQMASSSKTTNTRTMNSDGNSHPMVANMPVVGDYAVPAEYTETPSASITGGNGPTGFMGSDAAHEVKCQTCK